MIDNASAVGGGCINRCYRLQSSSSEFFVKLNAAQALPMFEAEAAALQEIATTATVRVPRPICTGSDRDRAWIVLEYLPLVPTAHDAMARLGQQLAGLHRVTGTHYGWTRDNTIGSTPQVNTPTADWVEFLRRHRLGFQLELAAHNGHGDALQRAGADLLARLPEFFTDYRPAASLLHGDLWGGNASATVDGEPVIFDPAVYYGDREADVAMTELFGGFPRAFYAAYEAHWPLDPGYRRRRDLYNLYHVLNHLNLFGGGYRAQAQSMIGALLA
jgi:protein-ribulosamine 3-kinase